MLAPSSKLICPYMTSVESLSSMGTWKCFRWGLLTSMPSTTHIYYIHVLCGHHMDYVDTIWTMWTPYGLCGHHMGYVDTIWTMWTPYGLCGHHMGYVATIWTMWTPYGLCGHHMDGLRRTQPLIHLSTCIDY